MSKSEHKSIESKAYDKFILKISASDRDKILLAIKNYYILT